MFDYAAIKTLAKSMNRSVDDLLALSKNNDPFYAAVGSRGAAAEWFAGMYRDYGGGGVPHLRRIHYRLVSPPEGVRILLPNGREYQNTENDWSYLCRASLASRYLDLIPFDGLVDRRNGEPVINAANNDPTEHLRVTSEVWGSVTYFDKPDPPSLPSLSVDGFKAIQDYIVEVWIEKSTQNDWLAPLCRRYGVNLLAGLGEQSETRARELALRSAQYKAPVRVLYLSDFDPGGRSMPKAVARKVEFTIHKFDLDVDFQLIPVALTPEQCRQYNLPRIPIKDTEKRKDAFEQTFGVGATELDAMEALYPGELQGIVEAEIRNWIDPDLGRRVSDARSDHAFQCQRIAARIHGQYEEQIGDLESRFKAIVEQLEEWESEADELWEKITEELKGAAPDFSDVVVPRSEAPGATDRFVLFDSKRDYLTQMDQYNAWKDGGESMESTEAPA